MFFPARKLESRSVVCSDAEGNVVEMESPNGAMGHNMTESNNATETSLCVLEKRPETTQECGASEKEEDDAQPTEEVTSEVKYILTLAKNYALSNICSR